MSTLSFDSFWAWLVQHPNCVLWAGTPDAVLYDDEDVHWYIGQDGEVAVAQVIRGKRLVGNLVVDPARVDYVSVVGEAREGEHHFELIAETETDRYAAYVFALSHGMTEDEEPTHRFAIH
ncbi:MAG: hypothetical protein KDD47_15120 [Acidobacteria bacterium]|nr:hypothetical protein [Acidobacteriota bacterium]